VAVERPGPPPSAEARSVLDRVAQEAQWRREVYVEDQPQLTLRAVVTGALIGGVLGISNLYVGLKAGWAMGIAITACVLSTALWHALSRLGLSRSPMHLLEQNCMQSTASAAGYPTGAILVTAVPAWAMISGQELSAWWLVTWTILLSSLGLLLALPFKRQLLHYEDLPWPSSVAAAQTLRTLHAEGSRAVSQARQLFGAALLSAVARWFMGADFRWWKLPALVEVLPVPGRLVGLPLTQWTVGLDLGPVIVGAGALLGLRTALSLIVGSTIAFVVVGPAMHASGMLVEVGFREVLMSFALWGGASLMLTASIAALLLQWRVLVRGARGLRALGPRRSAVEDPVADVEVPGRVVIIGVLALTALVAWVGQVGLGMAWWVSVAAVAMALLATLVASRATAETDITPVGSMGKVAQLTLGILRPANAATNLLGASIVSTSAVSGADLLTNLKCGRLLGANPRRQTIAQWLGILAGTAVVVPAYKLLVPTVDSLGNRGFPAPAAQAWRAVAELLAGGLGTLEPSARLALVVGAILGIVLALIGHLWPRIASHLPSPIALGMGMVIPFSTSAGFLLGAWVAWAFHRRRSVSQDDATGPVVSVSSGMIAGDSLVGVLLAILFAAA
jgi:putative OPT family oligopeptide transporter